MVTTIKGDMDEAMLEKRTGETDNENEHVTWIEYWLNGELVHRSANITLKIPVLAFGESASLK